MNFKLDDNGMPILEPAETFIVAIHAPSSGTRKVNPLGPEPGPSQTMCVQTMNGGEIGLYLQNYRRSWVLWFSNPDEDALHCIPWPPARIEIVRKHQALSG